MRTVRNALLATVTAAVLPVSGLGTQAATIAVELKNGLVELVNKAAHDRAGDFRVPGVRIRSAPNTGAPARGAGNPGDNATIHRKVNGETVRCPDGSANSEWLDVTNRRTRIGGFVSGCYI
ncbi:hypothetical protein [Saccharopolyspora phatthalungensis]|uniref:SH3 domain-containing protein n=1 Tax=Saccharopolyspora phatthalungensis TaxID=664693 RepID=A0A840Q4Y6_9PSEU|nr:hypothetical protein [Saccharopolyspora phatthalungensis]MBB5153749.1 hypothetical protein [Saccharopolyspora phatthalungensis]